MISKKFFAHSIIYTIVGALPVATPILLLPLYTAVLSERQVGEIALYIASLYIMQIIVNFSLDASVKTFYLDYQHHIKHLKEYLSTVYFSLVGLGILCLFIFSAIGVWFFPSVLGLTFFPFGFLTVLTSIFNSFFRTYAGILITQQRAIRFFYINFSQFLITIISTGGGLYLFPHTLWGPIAGRLVAATILFIFVSFFWIQEWGTKFNYIYLHKMWRFCIYMTLYLVFAWVVLYIDRYVINYYLDTAKVGIYDFATKCVAPIELFVIGLSNAVMPKVFQVWKSQNLNYTNIITNRYFNVMTLATLLSIAACIVLLPILIPFLVKNEVFYQSFAYIPYLAASFVFLPLLNVFVYTLLYLKKTNVISYYFALCAILQMILNPILIQNFGVNGAVADVIIIKLVMTVSFYWGAKKYFQFNFNWIKMLYLPLLYLILVLLAGYLKIPQLYPALILLILVMVVYFRPIIELLHTLKKRWA
ncbi:MAG: lipopolysaccharide biosynthesis protein [Bacteroidia bacterium]|nr:lipopolysaccharide biosynthesis protein [Bacteroidia bacterium]MDW8301961.1 lipopolysaccharide biosynthesis protein [Bacteroidia bacterium]